MHCANCECFLHCSGNPFPVLGNRPKSATDLSPVPLTRAIHLFITQIRPVSNSKKKQEISRIFINKLSIQNIQKVCFHFFHFTNGKKTLSPVILNFYFIKQVWTEKQNLRQSSSSGQKKVNSHFQLLPDLKTYRIYFNYSFRINSHIVQKNIGKTKLHFFLPTSLHWQSILLLDYQICQSIAKAWSTQHFQVQ